MRTTFTLLPHNLLLRTAVGACIFRISHLRLCTVHARHSTFRCMALFFLPLLPRSGDSGAKAFVWRQRRQRVFGSCAGCSACSYRATLAASRGVALSSGSLHRCCTPYIGSRGAAGADGSRSVVSDNRMACSSGWRHALRLPHASPPAVSSSIFHKHFCNVSAYTCGCARACRDARAAWNGDVRVLKHCGVVGGGAVLRHALSAHAINIFLHLVLPFSCTTLVMVICVAFPRIVAHVAHISMRFVSAQIYPRPAVFCRVHSRLGSQARWWMVVRQSNASTDIALLRRHCTRVVCVFEQADVCLNVTRTRTALNGISNIFRQVGYRAPWRGVMVYQATRARISAGDVRRRVSGNGVKANEEGRKAWRKYRQKGMAGKASERKWQAARRRGWGGGHTLGYSVGGRVACASRTR